MTTKRKQVNTLIIVASVMVAAVLMAFAPTIYRAILTNKDLCKLLGKYDYSYIVTTAKTTLVQCGNCDYVGIENANSGPITSCPTCKKQIERIYSDIYYTFNRNTKVENEYGVSYISEGGWVYHFATQEETEKGYALLSKLYDDEYVIICHGRHVFVLDEEPSEDLAKIIKKLTMQ